MFLGEPLGQEPRHRVPEFAAARHGAGHPVDAVHEPVEPDALGLDAGIGESLLSAEAARLDELRLAAIDERITAELELCRNDDLVVERGPMPRQRLEAAVQVRPRVVSHDDDGETRHGQRAHASRICSVRRAHSSHE